MHRRGLGLSWHSLRRVFIVAIARMLAAPTALRSRLRLLLVLWLLSLRRLLVLWLLMLRRLPLRLLVLRRLLRLLRRLVLRWLLMLLGLPLRLLVLRLPLRSLSVSVVPPAIMILIVFVGQCLAGCEAQQEDGAGKPDHNRLGQLNSSN